MSVIAVVQCKGWEGDNERNWKTRKIRIHFSTADQSTPSLSYTGKELQGALLKRVNDTLIQEGKLLCPSSSDSDGSPVLEIYDSELDMFIPLSSEALWDVDIARRFGRLIRCTVHISTIPAGSQGTEEQKQQPLAIMGRYYDFDANGMDYCGKTIVVKEICNKLSEDGTGLNVWDGSILLAKYIEAYPYIRGKRVLELGSGPGFVGISAGIVGAKEVVLTDLEYTMPLMQDNVERNLDAARSSGCERMECRVLDWYYPPSDIAEFGFSSRNIASSSDGCEIIASQPDVILVADCVWLEELVSPLLNAIINVSRQCRKKPHVIISYQRRGKSTHDSFMAGLQSGFDVIEEVDNACFKKPDVMCIFKCRVK